MDKAKWVGGLVKTVFILCYVAFMVASIRHVATFFNDFEPNNDNTLGSYALAGAFDITALVTTIGVMFFRKSMPKWVFWIVWMFIAAIAGYSYIINLEYASHYQDMTLLMQPTGATTPALDAHGNVHYVAVMQVNTTLEWINPFLASGFTIFSLIYSVIAEFFGTKAPTAAELLAKKKYLEETSGVMEDIRKLEEKGKKPGIIQRAKQSALEIKDAVKEVTKQEISEEEKPAHSPEKPERNTDKLSAIPAQKPAGNQEEIDEKAEGNHELTPEERLVASYYEKALSWLSDSGTTVPLKVVAETMNQSMLLLNNRVKMHKLQATKGKVNVYKSSVVAWAVSELIPRENQKIVQLKARGKREDSSEESEEIRQEKVSG